MCYSLRKKSGEADFPGNLLIISEVGIRHNQQILNAEERIGNVFFINYSGCGFTGLTSLDLYATFMSEDISMVTAC